MKILAIPGSLRQHSFNRRLLEAAGELAPQGMRMRVFGDLGCIPLFDEDLEDATRGDGNAAVVPLRQAVAEADGLLFATPEYNQSMPGVLKNAIDWLSRTDILAGKPSAILGATTGPWGTRHAQKELRHVLGSALSSRVMPAPSLFIARAGTHIDGDGRLTDERTVDSLRRFLAAFGKWIAVFDHHH